MTKNILSKTALVFVILAMLLVAVPATAQTTPTEASYEQQFLTKINAERSARGLAPMKMYWDLTDDARIHSDAMLARGRIYHTKSLSNVVSSGWEALSENVGAGPSVSSLHAAFMASAGHKRNILGNYTHVGIGVQRSSSGQMWATMIFARYGTSPTAGGGTELCTGSCDERNADSVMLRTGATFVIFDETSQYSAATKVTFGRTSDIPLMGDWNCDGVDTPGLYRPSRGRFYLDMEGTGKSTKTIAFGNGATDWPLAGDFNKNGCDSVGLYRKTSGQAFLSYDLNNSVEAAFYYGNPSDKPFVGDWNGDGRDTLGLHRESTGQVFLRNSNTAGPANLSFYFGNPGDVMLAGDWDGDGDDTVGIYRPSNGNVYLRNYNTQGNANYWFKVGSGFVAGSAW